MAFNVFKRIGTHPVKVSFNIEVSMVLFPEGNGLGPSDYVSVALEKGDKVITTADKAVQLEQTGEAYCEFNERLSFTATLYRDNNGKFQEKQAKLDVRLRKKGLAGLKHNRDAFKSLGVAPLKLNTLVGVQDTNLTLPLVWCVSEGTEIAITVTSYDHGIADADSDANSVSSATNKPGSVSGSLSGLPGAYTAGAGVGKSSQNRNGTAAGVAATAGGYLGYQGTGSQGGGGASRGGGKWGASTSNGSFDQDDHDDSFQVDPRLLGGVGTSAPAPAAVTAKYHDNYDDDDDNNVGTGGGAYGGWKQQQGGGKITAGLPPTTKLGKTLSSQAREALQSTDSDYGRRPGSAAVAVGKAKPFTKSQANDEEEEYVDDADAAGSSNLWGSRQRRNSAGSKSVGFRDYPAPYNNDTDESNDVAANTRGANLKGKVSTTNSGSASARTGSSPAIIDPAIVRELEELRAEVARLQDENLLLKSHRNEDKDDDDDDGVAAAKAEYFEGEAKQLQEALNTVTRERDRVVDDNQRLQEELRHTSEEVEALRQEAAQAQAEVVELNAQLDDAADAVAAATAKAQQYGSKANALEVELAEVQLALSAAQQRQTPTLAASAPIPAPPPSSRVSPFASIPAATTRSSPGSSPAPIPTAAAVATTSPVRASAEKSAAPVAGQQSSIRPGAVQSAPPQYQQPQQQQLNLSPRSPPGQQSSSQGRNPLLLGDDDLIHPSTTSGKQSAFSKRVYAFYMHYNPSKTSEVPALLEKFSGKEEELMLRLVRKYGKEPQVKRSEGDVLTLERHTAR